MIRISDLSAGSGQLRDALETLHLRWDETREHWHDGNSRRIEEQHLQPLDAEVMMALTIIQQLSETLAAAQALVRVVVTSVNRLAGGRP